MDIAEFLRRSPPFSALDEDRVRAIGRRVEIAHYPEDEVILRQDGPPAEALFVIRKGSVELLDDGLVLDRLGEGEVFGQFSLFAEESPTTTVRAHEDTLCYLIPADIASELLTTGAGRSFVLARMRDRVRAATDVARDELADPRYRAVGSLLRRDVVTAAPDTSIAEAAARMRDERISSLLLPMRGGFGIVTDRDLRTRLVAERGSADAPVGTIATFPAHTIPAQTLAGDALTEMLARDIHHLPVVDQGRLVGVVTDTDLMGIGRHTPFALKSALLRARTREEAVAAARELPDVVVALADARADPVEVGRVIALVLGALTERLLELASRELGSAPAPFAWLALGSAARFEQALHTDQDHALAFEAIPGEDPARLADAFLPLATFVTDGLEAAGIPRCEGNAMAIHPSMRRSVDAWAERIRTWMSQPDVQASILSSILFDIRRQAGTVDAEPALAAAIRHAASHSTFLRMMARRAIDLRPPTGFLGDLVVEAKGEHVGRLDVKHGGITIITNLARARALQAGSSVTGTLARLDAAAAAGVVDGAEAEELAQAFRFLWEIRLRHQAARTAASEPPDDFVDPKALGAFHRSGVKEAFHAIRRAQRQLAIEQGLDAR